MTTALNESVLRAAAHLAAAGDGRSALSLIAQLEEGGPSIPVLLLKAKVLAQLGQYDEAIGAWNGVLQAEADNPEALAGIHRAEKARAGLGRVFYRYSLAFQALLAFVGIAAALGLWAVPGLLHGKETRTGQGAIERINQRLDRLEAALAPLVADADGRITPVAGPGADLERVRARLGDLEKLLQTRTAELQKEVGLLRQQVAKGRETEKPVTTPPRAELDQLARRIDEVRAQAEGQHAKVSQNLADFQRRLDQTRCEQLMWQAIELSSRRRPLAESDLNELARMAQKIAALAQDDRARDYAQRLSAWVEIRRAAPPGID